MFAGVWRPCQPALCNGINGLGWTRTRWPNYRSKAWVTLRELGSFSLSRVSPSERRCYIRNVFSHWDPIQPQTEYWSALGQHIRTFSQSHTGNYIRCSSIVVVWYMLIDWLIDWSLFYLIDLYFTVAHGSYLCYNAYIVQHKMTNIVQNDALCIKIYMAQCAVSIIYPLKTYVMIRHFLNNVW